MIRALYSAASGMTAQQMSIDTIANNLANANTAGYKARRTQFQDLLYQNVIQPGTSAGSQTIVPNGLQLGLGTRPSTNAIIFTQGSFQETDNPLDMVIQGKGFFQIKLPSGTIAYTRAGNFQMDATGNIVDSNGNAMQPQRRQIVEVTGSVEQKRRCENRLVLAIKLGNQTWRGGEAQPWSPLARINHRKTKRFALPRVIQIKMKSAANQKSIVRLLKKLSVACFGDAQIFLGLFVTGIQAQRFTELNNGLRDLTLSQVKPA